MLISLLLLGCEFSAAGTTVSDDTDAVDTADDTAVGDDTAPPDPGAADDDEDGWTVDEGDCDDGDAAVHPGVPDRCDGVDEDCDGGVDEDAEADDDYEPNDSRAFDLGSLEDAPFRQVVGRFHAIGDVDRFSFEVVDHFWDSFTVTIQLSGVAAPGRTDVVLNRLRSDGAEPTGEVARASGADLVTLTLTDTSGPDDGGEYEVVLSPAATPDCMVTWALTVERE